MTSEATRLAFAPCCFGLACQSAPEHESFDQVREKISWKDGIGGEGGIRTLDRGLRPYSGLANRRPQPLGDFSAPAERLIKTGEV